MGAVGLGRTSGLEDPQGFAEHPWFVRGEVDDAVGDDGVRPVVLARQVLDLAEPELEPGRKHLRLSGAVARPGEHLRGHVHAHHLARRAHGVGGEEAVDARAASEVDDVLAGQELREPHGGAAADAQIRVANLGEVTGGVPDGASVVSGRYAAPSLGFGHLGVVRRDVRALRGGRVGGVRRRLDRHRHRPHREHRAARATKE